MVLKPAAEFPGAAHHSSKSLSANSTTPPPIPQALTRDQEFMRGALDLARAMLGLTTPNPAVGCIIVSNNKIVGRGATAPGGRPHGETVALADAAERARGATAYVS